MSIQATITMRNADVLRSFAAWWDAQAPGDVGVDRDGEFTIRYSLPRCQIEEPVPYTVAEPELATAVAMIPDLPPVAKPVSVHREDGRPADRPGSKEPEPVAKPAPASSAIITPTLKDFEAAVKTWFSEDAKVRGPKVNEALSAIGVTKLVDVPVDKFASVLADLGVS